MEHVVNKFTYKKTSARAHVFLYVYSHTHKRAHTHKYLHCQNFYKCNNYKYLKQPNSEAMKVLLTHHSNMDAPQCVNLDVPSDYMF